MNFLMVVFWLLLSAGQPKKELVGVDPPPVDLTCAIVPTNKTYFVPDSFSGDLRTSGGAAYYYPPAGAPCNKFVVDIRMTHTSNTQGNPQSDGALQLIGDAYDLPSSSPETPDTPGTPQDCERYLKKVEYWVKPLDSTGPFEQLAPPLESTGLWGPYGCQIQNSGGPAAVIAKVPAVGVMVYRVAVSVRERESGQEVAVIMQQPGLNVH
jgi:hypothetical protein